MSYINGYPDDAAEIASLVKKADLATATRLLEVWGSKQRDVGSLKTLEMLRAGAYAALETSLSKEPSNAQ